MDPMNLQAAVAVIEQSIVSATPADCPLLVGELEKLKALAWARMMQPVGPVVPDGGQQNGHYLTVEEVVERFKVTAKWLYRNKKQMPHSQPSRKCLLFPEQGITKWFASRKQY